jgi:hypothetical protein
VTVSGGSAADWSNQFTVLASYEGQGRLDDILSVVVSPERNGRFELAGLTPGRYRIQAAMDDIWLSTAVSVVVDADEVRSEPLILDMGRPGVPSVVRCVDPDSKPVVGCRVELLRPPGPLTEALWPIIFRSDGAGVVNLPPLEAGEHSFRVIGPEAEARQSTHSIRVRELTPEFSPSVLGVVIECD